MASVPGVLIPSLMEDGVSQRKSSHRSANWTKHDRDVLDRVDLGNGAREEIDGSTDTTGDQDGPRAK